MDVITIETPPLGDRSYLVHDGQVALVIDPQRDTDRVEKEAANAGVQLTHVAETHIHNDYVSGGLQLAKDHQAVYLVNAADQVAFDRTPISDGETVRIGRMTLRAVATPGHTHHHLSYLVEEAGQQLVFSGGSLLYGSVGRTDLISSDDTLPLTHAQYASVRRLVEETTPDAGLYPTHGFGSFCSSGPASGADFSTIGEQTRSNHALTDQDEDHFVQELIDNLSAYPSYYAHMGPANAAGPGPAKLDLPQPLDAEQLADRLGQGEWVIDLRNRVAFARDHLRGSVSFEYDDGTNFTTFVGWVLPWGQQFTLVGERHDVESAIRDLSRIGIDQPDVALGSNPTGLSPQSARSSYPSVGWEDLRSNRGPHDVVLDVRRSDEYETQHIEGAVNLPLHELLQRLDEVPDQKLWVHCGSGYRASVAASLLQRAGKDVVHIDGMFDDADDAGLPMDH
ncbi:MBL fold metallo-hydrolase [Arthrobacter sp. CAN_C5]|uniref:MBL fold metallo-hydrolase n=1 Tax=Arthrobacter sp. CAN_C5 TaxID=2760706 RepID=UPI001AEB9FFB|nr:MBL fold metallo-hydrolase [Arthrobacter sp. CAN_C5]MBP2214997.1 glyoxylase-like metal-dependent hydrolase (beta-lactamase superfamily II)/rhodanese-related sulfurtransferase [Arthrobacter sp. CAN_C5]